MIPRLRSGHAMFGRITGMVASLLITCICLGAPPQRIGYAATVNLAYWSSTFASMGYGLSEGQAVSDAPHSRIKAVTPFIMGGAVAPQKSLTCKIGVKPQTQYLLLVTWADLKHKVCAQILSPVATSSNTGKKATYASDLGSGFVLKTDSSTEITVKLASSSSTASYFAVALYEKGSSQKVSYDDMKILANNFGWLDLQQQSPHGVSFWGAYLGRDTYSRFVPNGYRADALSAAYALSDGMSDNFRVSVPTGLNEKDTGLPESVYLDGDKKRSHVSYTQKHRRKPENPYDMVILHNYSEPAFVGVMLKIR